MVLNEKRKIWEKQKREKIEWNMKQYFMFG